jgi:hypothetical protein
MTLAYRQRRISECIRRYVPAAISDGKHGARDTISGQLVEGASYDDPELARTKCRMLAAADIEEFLTGLLLPVLALLHAGKSAEAATALAKIVQENGGQP